MNTPKAALSYTVHRCSYRYSLQELQALMPYARRHHVDRDGRYLPSDQQIDVWSHPWDAAESRRLGQLRFLQVRLRPPELASMVCEQATRRELFIELGRPELNALGCVTHGDVPPATEG